MVIYLIPGNPYVQVLQEVAAGKKSRQSTQHAIHISGYANDGNLNTFSHTKDTKDDKSLYWEVDLGHYFKIRQVEIFVRKDCCGKLVVYIYKYKKKRCGMNANV